MRPFTTATLILLVLVAVVHALRLGQGWIITVNGADIPMWVSILGFVLAGGLVVGLWRETR
jgi:NAD/NADP transhydrogenase beta subunit